MPYYKSSQEWLEQSALLLQARPSTTKITTKYSVKPVKPRDGATEPVAPRGSLVIKTYDPVSGVALKYRTTKAAEVSRLVYSSLGQLGRGMAAVPEVPEEVMQDAPGAEAPSGEAPSQAASAPPQAGGGGKKKKKGRK